MCFLDRASSDILIFGIPNSKLALFPLHSIHLVFQSTRGDRDRKMDCVCACTYIVLFRGDDIHSTIKEVFQGCRMKHLKTATFIHVEFYLVHTFELFNPHSFTCQNSHAHFT